MNQIHLGNCFDLIDILVDESIDCVVTSPPYWGLRDYSTKDQLGNEPDFQEYLFNLSHLFDKLKPKLKPTATLWINLGDTYNNYKCESRNPETHSSNLSRPAKSDSDSLFTKKNINRVPKKSLLMIPARFAIDMTEQGFILRNEIIWHKPNPMPESVKDRCTKAHEMIYFFSVNKNYYSDFNQIKTVSKIAKDNRSTERKRKPNQIDNGMRKSGNYEYANKRDVWSVPVARSFEAHTAVFPEDLISPCIEAGCPVGGTVLDPFMGTGTTALVAQKLGRNCIGFEINQEYLNIANRRLAQLDIFTK